MWDLVQFFGELNWTVFSNSPKKKRDKLTDAFSRLRELYEGTVTAEMS